MKTEIIGLKVIKETVIRCGFCGTKLIDIVVSETNEHRVSRGLKPLSSRFQVLGCPKCEGHSFLSDPIEGSTSISPCGNFNIDPVETTIEDDIVISKIRIT